MNNTDLKMIANRLDEIHAMIHEINSNLDKYLNNRSKSNDVEQKLSDIIKSEAPIESKKVDIFDVLSELDKQLSSAMYKNTIAA